MSTPSGLQAALSENMILWTLEMNEQQVPPPTLACNRVQNTIHSSLCSFVSEKGPVFLFRVAH